MEVLSAGHKAAVARVKELETQCATLTGALNVKDAELRRLRGLNDGMQSAIASSEKVLVSNKERIGELQERLDKERAAWVHERQQLEARLEETRRDLAASERRVNELLAGRGPVDRVVSAVRKAVRR